MSTLGDNLNLYGLMLKPVQRFPQFLLILQDLLHSTSFDHADRVSLEGAVTSMDKVCEQLDQRSERVEQQQLFSKLVKLSKSEWSEGETGRVIRSGPVTEVIETKDDENPIELREGVLILTDAGKLLFLQNAKKMSAGRDRGKAAKGEIDGCKIKWKTEVDKIAIEDFATDPLSGKLGNRDGIQADIDRLSEIERLAGEMRLVDTRQLGLELGQLREELTRKAALVGSGTHVTVTLARAGGWKKHCRFSSAGSAREWIDIIRGCRIRQYNQQIEAEESGGGEGEHSWRTRDEDSPTTGAERVLPLFLGSVCVTPEVSFEHSRPETLTFLSYPSPSLDGSVLFWHGADDYIKISHIHAEDDIVHTHAYGRVFGRQVEPSVHSIQTKDVVSHLFQAFSAIWCFQADGDVFAFQDSAPFARLGITRNLTSSPVVQIINHSAGNFLVATRVGGVCLAALADSLRGGNSFQLAVLSEVVAPLPSPLPVRLIPVAIRDEVWCWRNGKVSVIKAAAVESEFSCREVGHVPLSASVCINSGVWVSRADLPTLYLYHVHTQSLMQTYDLSHSAFTVHAAHTFGVASLCTMSNLLIAGTTSGIVIALPLPKLAVSKPSVVGPASASIYGPAEKVTPIN